MSGVAGRIESGKRVARSLPQLWAEGAVIKDRAAKSGGFRPLSARFRCQNRIPAAPLCRRKNFWETAGGAVDDCCCTAAAGILIAWKGLADGGRVHLWVPTLRCPPNRFINREAQ